MNDRTHWLILAAQAGMTALAWPHLPDTIPIHWNIDGEPDGWAPKAVGAAIPLALNLAVYLLLRVLPRFDRSGRIANSAPTYDTARLALTTVLALLNAAALAAAAGLPVRIDQIVPALMSALLMVIGNGLGKIRPNTVIGIRTKSTLADPYIWHCTHRFAGPLWVLTGLCGLAASGIGGVAAGVTLFIALAVAVIVPVLYARALARRSP